MEFVFVLLLAFFFIVIYVLPVALVVFAILWAINSVSNKNESLVDEDICPVCQDTRDWCRHDP